MTAAADRLEAYRASSGAGPGCWGPTVDVLSRELDGHHSGLGRHQPDDQDSAALRGIAVWCSRDLLGAMLAAGL